MVAHAFDPSTRKRDREIAQFKASLHYSEFQATHHCYRERCLEKTTNDKTNKLTRKLVVSGSCLHLAIEAYLHVKSELLRSFNYSVSCLKKHCILPGDWHVCLFGSESENRADEVLSYGFGGSG